MTGKHCGAKTRAGGQCKRPAGWGTDHAGYGTCKLHFGATPNAKKHAAKEMAAELGAVLNIGPHEALEKAVGAANGILDFFQLKVSELEPTAYVTGDALNLWIREYREAQIDLARISKYAVDAGVAERHVRAIEQWSGPLAESLEHVLRDRELGLTDEQLKRAPKVVGRHLRALEAPAAERATA